MRNLEKEQRLGRNGIENLCIKPTFNYCTGEEQFTFFKLPKCLIDAACFLGLSIDAKLLYAIFLDRVSLIIINQIVFIGAICQYKLFYFVFVCITIFFRTASLSKNTDPAVQQNRIL